MQIGQYMLLSRKRSFLYVGVACLLFQVLFFSTISFAQNTKNEARVKAALIYNFAKYVNWSENDADRDDLFVFGILGANPELYSQLVNISSRKTVGGRRIIIKQFDSLADIQPAHILYVDPKLENPSFWSEVEGQSVLTVGHGESFIKNGGVVNFIDKDGRLCFVISVANAKKVGLSISSELLGLADQVISK